MNMKIHFGALCAFFIGSALVCTSQVKVQTIVTDTEAMTMRTEADTFLSSMPQGLQDRQADAIMKAMDGEPEELRNVRQSRNAVHKPSPSVEVVQIEGEGNAEGIAMSLFKPKKPQSKPLPLLVYLHGGGWTFGSINSCAAFCDAVAATGKAIVLAVDYSLAPENPFPKGLEDCIEAIKMAYANAAEWGSCDSLVSVGGDSSGGNLALAAALSLQKQPTPLRLQSLVLFYPVLKAYNDDSASWHKYGRGYGLDGRIMEVFNKTYIGDLDPTMPLISPAHADDTALKQLPPILIVNAQRDILCDQGKEFAQKHSNVTRVEFPGAVHLFITVKGQPTAFGKAVRLTTDFLTRNKE